MESFLRDFSLQEMFQHFVDFKHLQDSQGENCYSNSQMEILKWALLGILLYASSCPKRICNEKFFLEKVAERYFKLQYSCRIRILLKKFCLFATLLRESCLPKNDMHSRRSKPQSAMTMHFMSTFSLKSKIRSQNDTLDWSFILSWSYMNSKEPLWFIVKYQLNWFLVTRLLLASKVCQKTNMTNLSLHLFS